MVLYTKKRIKNKREAIAIVRSYMSRWRIEEYFRFKKEVYGFEDIRVRNLQSMKVLKRLLT